jgi:glycosyltransferase involved in cell wall biosynthesis
MLVGDGKERANVETIARELNLANVTLTGALPKSQMADVLSASDACLATLQNIPMFTKTYPNKVFDYMAAGRPVVLAIDGVIRTVIEEGQAGIFVPPGDSKALAEAVLALAVDPVRCAQLGANGRRYVIQHFERAQQARQFEQLMVDLANHSLKKGDIGWR